MNQNQKSSQRKKYKLALVLCILLFIGIVIFLKHTGGKEEAAKKEIANTVKSDGNVNNDGPEKEQDNDYILYSGYSNIYASKDEPIILLENREANDVYLTYEVVVNETGEVVLEETGLITPGTAYEWNAKEALDVGTYTVTFNIRSYTMDESQTAETPVCMDNITLTIY